MRILVTGGAGFIGSHLCERLIADSHQVVAVDNFNSFYDPEIKRANLAALVDNPSFKLIEADILEPAVIERQLQGGPAIDVIVHLAARPGVRPSIDDPLLYAEANVSGTNAVLELARSLGVPRFIFGSSSSVYGNNERAPFNEMDPADLPNSPYAATKRAGELLCHTYHHLYGLSVVCLRFFTVFGPRQRPDLAIQKFARLILQGQPVPMYGDGSSRRDYTYISDIVQGILGAIGYTETNRTFEVINLGESQTTSLRELIDLLGKVFEVEPRVVMHPPQPGDMLLTYADITRARNLLGYEPTTSVEAGLEAFRDWFFQQPAFEASALRNS